MSHSNTFCILGFELSTDDDIFNKALKLAEKSEEAKKRPLEEYRCCSNCECDYSIKNNIKCDKCGALIKISTRHKWHGYDDLFSAIGLKYHENISYEQYEAIWGKYGMICGFDVEGKSFEDVVKLHKQLIDMFGLDVFPKIMSGGVEFYKKESYWWKQ